MDSRLPRFTRVASVSRFKLTNRDSEIIRQVHRHRFLRSQHIVSLAEDSPQAILRRLQLLFHHGFLERPRCQLDSYFKSGSQPIVYALGNKGATLLAREGAAVICRRSGEKNRSIRRPYLEHSLSVADIMVALELACRKSGKTQFFGPDQLSSAARRWRVKLYSRMTLGLIPDQFFGLELPSGEHAHFFIEADRGTMPVVRSGLSQTSMYRKFLAYAETWKQGIHRSQFGFRRFRVLIVTTGPKRISSLIDAVSLLKYGRNLFLFADAKELKQAPLEYSWHTVIPGQPATLLD